MSLRDLVILGCSSQQPTRFRNHGAYLLRWNGEGFLFDPGEGTQRQFIFADIAPPVVNRIFISHFHGDHCLGFGSMLMRLNLDKVTHPLQCYYPASCKKFLEHGVENIGWRITEVDTIKFDKASLQAAGVKGPLVRTLEKEGKVQVDGRWVLLEEVSSIRKGAVFAYVVDTRPCPAAFELAQGAKLFVCESTYLDQEKDLAKEYMHMTALQAAEIAKKAGVDTLVLTHFSARYRDAEELGKEARVIFPNTVVAEDLKRIPFPK
jgi:ribonuclease Z